MLLGARDGLLAHQHLRGKDKFDGAASGAQLLDELGMSQVADRRAPSLHKRVANTDAAAAREMQGTMGGRPLLSRTADIDMHDGVEIARLGQVHAEPFDRVWKVSFNASDDIRSLSRTGPKQRLAQQHRRRRDKLELQPIPALHERNHLPA